MTRPLYGLVLAGGESRRMGQDKALLQHGGRSQLAHTVALLEAQLERVFVSVRDAPAAGSERARFTCLVDSVPVAGPMAGIATARAAYPDVDWLVVACDLPNIDAETLRQLIDERPAEQPVAAFQSSHDGLPEPLCAIYADGADKLLDDAIAAGMHCPRKMLIHAGIPLLRANNPAALDNINTPGDLESSVLAAGS